MTKRGRLLPISQVPLRESGALLVEALVVSVVVTIALLGTIGLINISTQQRNRAGERNQLNAAIDADLADIRNVASQITCCSGACTIGIPAGVTPDDEAPFESPCFTDNRRDDRYFYPQIDSDPDTPEQSEALTVNCICGGAGIFNTINLATAFPVNPAIGAAGGQRALGLLGISNGDQNILLVTYTDNNAANPATPVRVVRVVPPMARFCEPLVNPGECTP